MTSDASRKTRTRGRSLFFGRAKRSAFERAVSMRKMTIMYSDKETAKREDCEIKPILEKFSLIFSSRNLALWRDWLSFILSIFVIAWLLFIIVYGLMHSKEWAIDTKTDIDTSEQSEIQAPNIGICSYIPSNGVPQHTGASADLYDSIEIFGQNVKTQSLKVSTEFVALYGGDTKYECSVVVPDLSFTNPRLSGTGKQPIIQFTVLTNIPDTIEGSGSPSDNLDPYTIRTAALSIFHPQDTIQQGNIAWVSTQAISFVTFTYTQSTSNTAKPQNSYVLSSSSVPATKLPCTDDFNLCANVLRRDAIFLVFYPASYVVTTVNVNKSSFYFWNSLGAFWSVFEFGFGLVTLALYWLFFWGHKYLKPKWNRYQMRKQSAGPSESPAFSPQKVLPSSLGTTSTADSPTIIEVDPPVTGNVRLKAVDRVRARELPRRPDVPVEGRGGDDDNKDSESRDLEWGNGVGSNR